MAQMEQRSQGLWLLRIVEGQLSTQKIPHPTCASDELTQGVNSAENPENEERGLKKLEGTAKRKITPAQREQVLQKAIVEMQEQLADARIEVEATPQPTPRITETNDADGCREFGLEPSQSRTSRSGF